VLRELVDVLAAAATVTAPVPLPVLPFVTVSQLALLPAVHVQPLPAVTPIDPTLAVAASVSVVLDNAKLHDVPACVTVAIWPPTVTVAVRELAPVFTVVEKETVPLPEPELPLVIVSQLAVLAAFQAQVEPVVTATAPALAPEPSDTELGVRVYGQDD